MILRFFTETLYGTKKKLKTLLTVNKKIQRRIQCPGKFLRLNLLQKIVDSFQKLTIFAKSLILDT